MNKIITWGRNTSAKVTKISITTRSTTSNHFEILLLNQAFSIRVQIRTVYSIDTASKRSIYEDLYTPS